MPRPPVIEINDDFTRLIGEPTAQRLVSRVHSDGDCQTCGSPLGARPVNLLAQCLIRSAEGVGPWVVTAHHIECERPGMTQTGSVKINSSIGITYRAVGLTLHPGQPGTGGLLARMQAAEPALQTPAPLLWVCPSIDFFLVDVVSHGNAIDRDLQQYLREPGFHNMIDSLPSSRDSHGPQGAHAVLDGGLLLTTPPMGWSLAIEAGGQYERAIRANGAVTVLVSTSGAIHTPGLLDAALDPLIDAGEVAGAWVPLASHS